jgi:CubicO group peptidase (beta-lactamase class C family)
MLALPVDAADPTVGFAQDLETLREALGIPGMAAAVVSDGEVVFAEGFGYVDLDEQRPADPSTPFGLASVTKPIAATLIMSLVEDGLIDLDAPVASYGVTILGDRGITVRHLLTHTSEGEPGTRHEYNGDRYGLLGGVIEGATGRTFAELLSEWILLPVGMGDTALNPLNNWGGLSSSGLEDFGRVLGWGENFEHYPDVYRRLATPYQFGDRYEIVPGMYHLFHNPAAGLVSSVSDLAAFDIALDRGDLVTPESLMEMTSPAVRTQPARPDLNYGLGWYVQDFEGMRMVWHTGRWPPSTSALYLKIPELGLSFIVEANTDNLTVPFPGIGGGDLSKSAPMLTFFHHVVYPLISGTELPAIDWSENRAVLLNGLRDVEDPRARTMLERELWSYRQAYASSGQTAQADVLRGVAAVAFGASPMSRDAGFTSTVGKWEILPGLPSAATFVRLAVGVMAWLAVVAVSLVWMLVRLVRDPGAGWWDRGVWMAATAIVGPLGPVVHRSGWSRARAAVMCVVGYSIAWTIAVWIMITLAEPNPLVIIAVTMILPIVVSLLAIRAHVIERATGGGMRSAVRRGALAEFVTWSVGFAVFFPLTFLANAHVLSTIPAPSSPFFGALLSVIAFVAVLVLTGFDSVIGRLGYRLWPGAPSPSGSAAGLRLPTLGDSRLITLAAVALFVVVLAVSIALFG